MLDLLTISPPRALAPVVAHVRAAHNLRDRALLEYEATLALKVARNIYDEPAIAFASIFLGLARRDPRLIEAGARGFELQRDWYNAAVAWCITVAFTKAQGRKLILLHSALEHCRRATRQFAQAGDEARWQQARDVEREIELEIDGAASGRRWIE